MGILSLIPVLQLRVVVFQRLPERSEGRIYTPHTAGSTAWLMNFSIRLGTFFTSIAGHQVTGRS